jgi:outer membrane protein assembly factor BamB
MAMVCPVSTVEPSSRRRIGPPPSPARAAPLTALVIVALAVTAAVVLTVATTGAVAAGAVTVIPGSWTAYHGGSTGTGVATTPTAVYTAVRAWTSPELDGDLYGQPVVAGALVYVATENDTVYALSSTDGAVVWSAHVATPVPSTALPCGDIGPTVGITGTPVVDPTRDEIFAVADELVAGQPKHVLIGLSAATGKLELTQAVDPSGADPAALLQRTGLTLDAGQVVFGMGGNDGDCATYRGRVIAVPEAGGTPRFFTVDGDSGQSQGAVWMGGGAPAVDAAGHIWVSTGNGSVYSATDPYDDSDSVLELSSSLHLLQYFAPTSWPSNNAHDLDMSAVPALLSDGQVVLAGKSRIAYLLDGSHLGGIGGQQAQLATGCTQDIDGGVAVVGTTVYLPCLAGVLGLSASDSPPSLHLLWRSGAGGGPPIVAAGLVWTIGQNGVLDGLDPATGAVERRASVGVPANHFPTPGVGDGLLLVPSARQVVAFAATTPTTPTTVPPTTSTTTGRHAGAAPPAATSGLSGGGLAAIVVLSVVAAAVVVGGVVLFLRRRRTGVVGQGGGPGPGPTGTG